MIPRDFILEWRERDARIPFTSQEQAIELAKDVNGATGRETGCGEGCTIYSGVAPVIALIHPGGHSWPPNASDLIAKFFRAHALTPQDSRAR